MVTPSALSIIIPFKIAKSKEFFIEFRKEKLSQKVSKFAKFTKVFPRQSFSILSL